MQLSTALNTGKVLADGGGQRRQCLKVGLLWAASGGRVSAQSAQGGNVVELEGEVRANGQIIGPAHTIQSGDRLELGDDARLVCVVGQVALHVRANTQLTLRRGRTSSTVGELLLTRGAVASVWHQSASALVVTPNASVPVKDTGVYTEVSIAKHRSYFCRCYQAAPDHGSADDARADGEPRSSHEAVWIDEVNGVPNAQTPAPVLHHSDQELAFLARLLGQKTAWQRTPRVNQSEEAAWLERLTKQILD
jgi:hypothetical protein